MLSRDAFRTLTCTRGQVRLAIVMQGMVRVMQGMVRVMQGMVRMMQGMARMSPGSLTSSPSSLAALYFSCSLALPSLTWGGGVT